MDYALTAKDPEFLAKVDIGGSKSETNRLLILKALYPDLEIENPSESDDSRVLKEALQTDAETIDIGAAGTAMRFLTAYLAFRPGTRILTGNRRMQNRPIGILVEALNYLGADIRYVNRPGYPPLQINGAEATGRNVNLRADVSSQFVTALLLIAPRLPKGLEIKLEGKVSSRPYIEMTLGLLRQIGVRILVDKNRLTVFPRAKIVPQKIEIEPDWSSASYFYSLVALARSAEIRLPGLSQNSLQGDAVLRQLYKAFGVKSAFENAELVLTKQTSVDLPQNFDTDLSAHPDLAQTLAVTCLGLNIPCRLRGVHSLRIKETDRLSALKNELKKFKAFVTISDDSLSCVPQSGVPKNVYVNTYDDHRMAMAFAPLVLKTPLIIENVEVVSKSFPGFWRGLGQCGIGIRKLK